MSQEFPVHSANSARPLRPHFAFYYSLGKPQQDCNRSTFQRPFRHTWMLAVFASHRNGF
jgi:hypothetical protein